MNYADPSNEDLSNHLCCSFQAEDGADGRIMEISKQVKKRRKSKLDEE
jgi:hypothetical protein